MLQPRVLWSSHAAARSLCYPCLRQYVTKVEPVATTPASDPLQASVRTAETSTRALDTDKTPVAAQPQQSARRQQTVFAMRTYKPRTPSIRHLKRPINDHLWKGRPLRSLTFPKIGGGKGGRNNRGRVTVRHRGGGHRRRIRTVDFNRNKPGPHRVLRIEYDPNRSAHLALLECVADKENSYIIAAEGMREGDVVESFRAGIPAKMLEELGGVPDPGMLAVKTALRGNCLPIRMVPLGSQVYNVGSAKERGAVFCRSAGTYAIVVSKVERDETNKGAKQISDGNDNVTAPVSLDKMETEKLSQPTTDSPEASVPNTTSTRPAWMIKRDKKRSKQSEFTSVIVRLQSGELRKVSSDACCTMGVASNPHHHFRQLGKAGRSRWLNIRPTVRGVAMNTVDHPHGGGRGKSKGNRQPVSPWGTPAKGGYKTRKKRNVNIWVVKERERNQGKRRNKNA
ncbi:MAG: hypothetical protein M1820_006871 [Bogoriella megaspora]|nr:MAG: hypothetical protein M1820_006871 [Bogoriella megaspora]